MFVCSCGTKKNTAYRRFYQGFTTRYNVYFNGNESFKKGYKKIEEGYQPDYSHIIDMFAVSDASTKGLGKSDMKIATDKCQKAIKEHSIRKKPKKNLGKTRDPKYMEFYNQEEFNPMMGKVWMLLGKSKYYSNDYLAASATFSYIAKHFSENKTLVAQAQIWQAKSLKEMDWTYAAANTLTNVPDDYFDKKTNRLYLSAFADLKIKQGELNDALSYLLKAIEVEKDKTLRKRMKFIAAQIYQQQGDKSNAYKLYEEVNKSNPDYQMGFNAKIRETEVNEGQNSEYIIKSLLKMSKKSNNKDYLDQIFYAVGNVYLNNKDTANAIANYKKAIEKSTRNGLDKAQVLLTLGNLYYNQRDYIKASPYYADASQIIDQSYPDYEQIEKKSQILGELSQKEEIINLQDSLQNLSKMSKEEQISAINLLMKKKEEEEKLEQEKRQKQLEENKKLDLEIENMAVMNKQAMGGKQTADWYFYNQNTISKGKIEFQRKYGNRRLEDNWNRKDKAYIASTNEENDLGKSDSEDSTKGTDNSDKKTEKNGLEYYLNQIPNSKEQIESSNQQLSDALFEQAIIYYEKLEDYEKAKEIFDEFIKRFPKDKRSADADFYCFRLSEKEGETAIANQYKEDIINNYPDTRYAEILSKPNYQREIEQMQNEQDSIYERTYKNYINNKYQEVITASNEIEAKYPISPLIPKFLILKALSEGKLGEQELLNNDLNKIINQYPNSDITSMAKDIKALIEQGSKPKSGSSSSLALLRERTLNDSVSENSILKRFRLEEKTPYLYYLITDSKTINTNILLYNIATYNFTKFLVKDFDIKTKDGIMVISGLDNLDEALHYLDGIKNDTEIQKQLKGEKYTDLVISKENSELIGRGFSLTDYQKFYQDSIVNRKQKKASTEIELVGEQTAIDSIAKENNTKNIKMGDDLVKNKQQNIQKGTNKKLETQSTKETPKPNIEQSVVTQQEKPWKTDLKKYKGLYTYDADADHVFAILVTEETNDIQKYIDAINEFNKSNQPLLNLRISVTSGKGFPKIIEVRLLPNAKTAKAYLLQLTKNDAIRDLLKDLPHKRVVISTQNLETLKQTGNINVYMELFRRLYLGR